jgi:hypothetical protein
VIAFVLWGASYLIYFRTLFPYPLQGDSAEFAVLGAQVGVTHNPGYPIYIALLKLWTFLPAGDIAYRANLFSAFMAAVAVAIVYVATTLLTRERVAGIFAASALAVSWTFWSQAVIAEVYTAGAAALSLILAALFGWYSTGARWPLAVAGAVGALSLGIHSTTALLAPAVFLFLLAAWRGRPNPWLHAVGGVALGFVLYLAVFALVDWNAPPASMFNTSYIPGASAFGLAPEDFDTVAERMWFNGTAGQWRGAMFAAWDTLPQRIAEYRANFSREFGLAVLVMINLGFLTMLARTPAVMLLIAVGLLLQWVFAFTYRIGDYYVFHIAGYVLLVIAAGAGVGTFIRIVRQGTFAVRLGVLMVLLLVGVWPTLAPRWPDVVAGRVPFLNAPGYPAHSQSVADYVAIDGIVEGLPPDAIVFVDWNRLYLYWYAAQIAGDRTDLRFIEPYTEWNRRSLPDSTVQFIRDNIDAHPILIEQPILRLLDRGFRFERISVGTGELFQIVQE